MRPFLVEYHRAAATVAADVFASRVLTQLTSSPQLSPDGNWWWDSTAWRQVSPDKRWWWDGAQWRTFPAKEGSKPAPQSNSDGLLRRVRLRYTGTCILCGAELKKGTFAMYHQPTVTVRCVECATESVNRKPRPLDEGIAGASANREYERRKAIREERVRRSLGNTLGGLALAIGGDAPSTNAWKRGSIGEAKVAEALRGVEGVRVLSDRRVPHTRGNIDQIVIAPAGVFVIDAKLYRGLISIKDRGGWFQRDERLYVGGRDRSHLADNMTWQVEAVQRVLVSTGARFVAVPVQPVLCFVDAEWSLRASRSYRGVRLAGLRSIKELVTQFRLLNSEDVETLSHILATAFPTR